MADESLNAPTVPSPSRPKPAPTAPGPDVSRARLPVHVFGALCVFMALAIAFIGLSPPRVVPASAPDDVFSGERAMRHVHELCTQPRHVGSKGHEDARALLLTRLRELGLEPEVQKTSSTQKFFGRISGATIENVIARVAGRGSDHRAILFAAHYDSVPHSLGAGDDGSGTAALLEAAHAIVRGPPLDRDVLFVFTDGEELGLLGAHAFVTEHPAAKEVVAAFNFDARGTKGSLAMFDTSDGNGALLELLSHAQHVQASSFVSTLAKLLPNDTDATIFKKAGIPTMSFAIADGVENYHRATDAPARLDARSVQAMGDTVVTLARTLGRGPLPALDGDDVAYLTLFGRMLVRVSFSSARLAGVLALTLAALAAFMSIKRRVVRAGGVLAGAGAALGAVALSGGTGTLLHFAMNVSASADARMARSGALGWAGASLTVLTALGVLRFAARRAGSRAVCLGAMLVVALLGAIAALLAPPASLPFVASGLVGVIPALAIAALGERAQHVRQGAFYLAAATAALVWFPTLYSVTIAAAAMATIPVAVLSAPLALFVVPFAASASRRASWVFVGGAAVVVAFGFARLAWPLGDQVPLRSTVAYGVDADRKQGFYFGSQPRPWMNPVLSADKTQTRTLPELTLTDTTFWVGPAEVSGVDGAALERTDRRKISEGFETRVSIRPSKDARCISLWDETRRIADVASVNGKPVRHLVRFSPEKDEELMRTLRTGVRPAFVFQFCGPGGEPIEVVFQSHGEAEIPVRLIETRDGLPPAPGGAMLLRPSTEIPTDDSDQTVIGKTVKL